MSRPLILLSVVLIPIFLLSREPRIPEELADWGHCFVADVGGDVWHALYLCPRLNGPREDGTLRTVHFYDDLTPEEQERFGEPCEVCQEMLLRVALRDGDFIDEEVRRRAEAFRIALKPPRGPIPPGLNSGDDETRSPQVDVMSQAPSGESRVVSNKGKDTKKVQVVKCHRQTVTREKFGCCVQLARGEQSKGSPRCCSSERKWLIGGNLRHWVARLKNCSNSSQH